MGSDLSIVVQTHVPSPDDVVQAFQTAGLLARRDPLHYVELRIIKADAAVAFINEARATANNGRTRNQVSLLVANCYSYVVGSSNSGARKTATAGDDGTGNGEKEEDQEAVFDLVRHTLRHEASCGKRIGLVVDASVQLGERVQEPQQGYRFARGTTYFLSSLLSALEYDVPPDEEIWTFSESPSPTLYLLDVRNNGLDDFSGPWLMKDVLERARRVRHHALTVRRQELVHRRIAQRHGGGGGAAAGDSIELPPPPKMVMDTAHENNNETSSSGGARRPSASSIATTDILAAMDGYSGSDGAALRQGSDAHAGLAKKDLILDIPIYMPNTRSDLFVGSLQCVLLADNDLTLNGVNYVLNQLFQSAGPVDATGSVLAASTITSSSRTPARPPQSSPQWPADAGASADSRQVVVASDAAALLLPYLQLIDLRRNAFDERDAEALLHDRVGPVVEAREMTVLDAPGKPPPPLTPLEKQRIELEKKTEERRRQREEAKQRKEAKKKKMEEERQKLLEERKRVQREKAARQRQREEAERQQREQEKRELLAAMDALRNPPVTNSTVHEEEEEEDAAERAARQVAPSDAGDWLDDEGGLVRGDVPEEAPAPPPPTALPPPRRSLSPRSPQPTGAPPSRDQQPAATPKTMKSVPPLSREALARDLSAPPQLKDKDWAPQYARRRSRTPRQPLPTGESPRAAPPPQTNPEHVPLVLSTSPSPSPANPARPRTPPTATAAPADAPPPVVSPTPRKTRKPAAPPSSSPPVAAVAPSSTRSAPQRSSRHPDPTPADRSDAAQSVASHDTPLSKAAKAPVVPEEETLPRPRLQPPQRRKAPLAPPPAKPAATAPPAPAAAAPAPVNRSVAPDPVDPAPPAHRPPPRVAATRAPPVPTAYSHHDDPDDTSDSDGGDPDLLWVDPYTGELPGADGCYPPLPDEAPDVVRARRSYSRGQGQRTPRRLVQSSPFTPPALPIAPPPPLTQTYPQQQRQQPQPQPVERQPSSGSLDEMRHSPRKSHWSEEAEERRFNEGVATPHERTVSPDAPHTRRSTAGLPPMAPSSSRRSLSCDHVLDDGSDGDNDDISLGDRSDEEEPLIDHRHPMPTAAPYTAQKPHRPSDTQHQPQEIPPSPMQSLSRLPRAGPATAVAPNHLERQSIRRDSTEEREWRAQQQREQPRVDSDSHEDEEDEENAPAAPSKCSSRGQPPVVTNVATPPSHDEDSWTRDVYDEKDPDVWGPPYQPPKKRRASRTKPAPARPQTPEEDEAAASNAVPYDENDPDVWGPPYQPPKMRRASRTKPAPARPQTPEEDEAAASNAAPYDENDPDVWGPPYQPPKKRKASSARPRTARASRANGGAPHDRRSLATDDRRASYVVPFSTATSRMRAFNGRQSRAAQERTASQDARLRLAARPALSYRDGDVFRSPRKETFVDPGPEPLEGLVVDQDGEPLDEQPATVGTPRAPSLFKRHDSAQQHGLSHPRGAGDDWHYTFPISPSRAAAEQEGENDSLAGGRQPSPAPKPYIADVLPRDGIMQTPSVSPSSHALDSTYARGRVVAAGESSLRLRPSVLHPGLGYVPPHPELRTRSRSHGR